MFRAIDRCPKPVIVRVHGAAIAGGAGLCAVADAVVADDAAVFGFTETKLGIIPAVIAPFVVAKIGASHARRLFLTGERFDARARAAIGLVHEVVPADALDAAVDAHPARARQRRTERRSRRRRRCSRRCRGVVRRGARDHRARHRAPARDRPKRKKVCARSSSAARAAWAAR